MMTETVSEVSSSEVATNPEGSITEAGLSGILYAWQSDYEKAAVAFAEAMARVEHQHLD
jgi:hypothetical protein